MGSDQRQSAGRRLCGGCRVPIRVRGTATGNVTAGSCSIQIDGAATLGDVSIYNGVTLVTLGAFSATSFSSNACVWYYLDGTTLPPSPGVCFPLPKPADVRLSATSYFGAIHRHARPVSQVTAIHGNVREHGETERRVPQSTAQRQLLEGVSRVRSMSRQLTGKTLAVVASKNGGGFANPHCRRD